MREELLRVLDGEGVNQRRYGVRRCSPDAPRHLGWWLSITAGVTGGLLAGIVVKQIWKRISDKADAPEASDAA